MARKKSQKQICSPFFHGTEIGVHFLKFFPGAVEIFGGGLEVPQKEEIDEEDDEEDGDEAPDPLNIHKFAAGELLHVRDGH